MDHNMNEMNGSQVIRARVMRAERCCLWVCDLETEQILLVHYHRACCFAAGDCVCVRYNGMMTRSVPPQITAIDVTCMHD